MTNVPVGNAYHGNMAVTVSSLVSAFLNGRKKTTIRAYRQDLNDFMAFTKNQNIEEAATLLLQLSSGQANLLVLDFKNYLVDVKKLSPATINRRLAAIRSLVQLAKALGLVSWNVEIENQQSQAYRDTKGIEIESINKIISYLESKADSKSIRDLAIVRLLFDLGLRREEICTIDLGDINFKDSIVKILGKARNEKELLSLPLTTLIAINNWIEIRGSFEGSLFHRLDRASGGNAKRLTGSGLYAIITELGSKLGLSALTVHKFRHSAITACCEVIRDNNLGLESLVKFSRHKSLDTALIYMRHLEGKQKVLSDLVSTKICRGQK